MTKSFILHLDMNSYFASVEQQANPLLRGKPVAVVAYRSRNGCVLASSKEAKVFGVKTGMRASDALQLCPQMIVLENDPSKYSCTTKRIFKILADYTGEIEPYSIDEAFLDLCGHIRSYEEGKALIRLIKRRIHEEVGEWLTCSAGLSWTRWFAKFAGDVAPKGGYVVIDSLEKAREVFATVKLTAAWGIGERIEARLNRLGIHSLRELQSYPVENLMRALGKYGYYLWANVNGIPVEEVKDREEQQPKSIGHSYCVPKKTTDMRYVRAVLMKLCERAGRRLRSKGLEARGIHAGYTTHAHTHMFKEHKLEFPLYTGADIFAAANRIIGAHPPLTPVRMIAISVTRLAPVSGQLNMFRDESRRRSLSAALDAVNNRYGEFTVIPGTMWGMGNQALERIGYRKSVDVEDKEEDISYDMVY